MQQDSQISHNIRVKFCGITQVEDADIAQKLGVHAIGLVFYDKSPRCVNYIQAKRIIHHLAPFVTVTGLFVNQPLAWVNQVSDELSLDLIQLHGDEKPEYCEQLHRPFIKAVRVKSQQTILDAQTLFSRAKALLLDSYQQQHFGGTGQSFDWNMIPETLTKPVILAGGLTPENVRLAIETIKPYAVDVSSGIEKAKGQKDKQKMIDFMNEVNHAK